MKENLLGKTPEELRAAAVSLGLPAFTGSQLARWMYVSGARSFDEMTNISKAARQTLSATFSVGISAPAAVSVSCDGTKKYLFKVSCPGVSSCGESFIEAVMIPDGERKTLCVSSQAGCRMGCRFCMTGRQGFHGNLSVSDILNQFLSVDEAGELTNAVFMGMGEPLDNADAVFRALTALTSEWGFAWSPKRITLSTIGVLPGLKRYLDGFRSHLAVSLHNPFSDERLEMMPAQKVWPAARIIELLRQYDFSGQRRVSFEYTMFAGFNDDKRHADALIRLLSGMECRVNLIRFHKIPDFPYECPPDVVMERFRDRLSSHGVTCTIRASRGEDILAACGLLAGRQTIKD
ncbi:MAG: 23S rRNA (adenine(2503)-C(2))-methyltransferase RlmN [Bacteroidales bacterium]|nr:23S rRNA (adenine(2503)-C(2))-methyltransferase RlmN [Bacteroidales bacterium]